MVVNSLIRARIRIPGSDGSTDWSNLAQALYSVDPAFLDLGDLVAGGDGTGLGGGPNGHSELWGLDQDTGRFLTRSEINFDRKSDQDGTNPTPVAGSPFVDASGSPFSLASVG